MSNIIILLALSLDDQFSIIFILLIQALCHHAKIDKLDKP